jgi:nucleoside phosphorylase
MTRRRLRCEDYNVGWVCALPIELAAAQEMLDEEHQGLAQYLNDTNVYTLGRIGEHNVVLACLPAGRTGTNCATAVAIEMKSKFTAIRFGLIVGIGGGVPSAESDVRLGDVVVSQPYMEHGGVIQYDFGKTTPSGFVRTGYLNTPPTVLLNALTKLQSQHLRGRSNLAAYLPQRFAYDNVEPDILFEPTYNHVGGPTCGGCSKDRLVERPSHRTQEVIVHYGTIASGNQVMKDGVTRDMLSSELGGVLCFEMEAAGLMNSFPCLVIRGICDYADSHKNKRWQPYAAATAAACAKEVLSVIPALEVVESTACLPRLVVRDEIRRVPARATNQHQNIASEFINNNLSNFYDRDPAFLEDLAQTATARAQRATEEFGLGPEFTPKLAKLGLYDFVILCGRPSTSHASIGTLSQQ